VGGTIAIGGDIAEEAVCLQSFDLALQQSDFVSIEEVRDGEESVSLESGVLVGGEHWRYCRVFAFLSD
jgi:hypothetical protein